MSGVDVCHILEIAFASSAKSVNIWLSVLDSLAPVEVKSVVDYLVFDCSIIYLVLFKFSEYIGWVWAWKSRSGVEMQM